MEESFDGHAQITSSFAVRNIPCAFRELGANANKNIVAMRVEGGKVRIREGKGTMLDQL